MTPETAARDVFLEQDDHPKFFNNNNNNDTGGPRKRRAAAAAIVSRSIHGLQPYVDALQQKQGIAARLITDQSGVQDFCFLMKSRTELVCSWQSTFCRWASVLSNVTSVRYYTLDQNLESSTFSINSTSRKRITSTKHVANRSFVWEQYWQPYEPQPYDPVLVVLLLFGCFVVILLACWSASRKLIQNSSSRIQAPPKCSGL